MCAGHRPPHGAGGGLGAVWENIRRSDAPLPERLRMISVNYWRRVRLAQACCGHYGEPGC
jgi:hypothetical protein